MSDERGIGGGYGGYGGYGGWVSFSAVRVRCGVRCCGGLGCTKQLSEVLLFIHERAYT